MLNAHPGTWLKHSTDTDVARIQTLNVFHCPTHYSIWGFPYSFPEQTNQRDSLLDLFLTSSLRSSRSCQHSPLGNSDNCMISMDISLQLPIKQETWLHKTSFGYQNADWDSLHDFLRYVPWTGIFNTTNENCATQVSSWLKAGIDLFIPSRKYQVEPQSSPSFKPAYSSAIAKRNHYFCYTRVRALVSTGTYSLLLVININESLNQLSLCLPRE